MQMNLFEQKAKQINEAEKLEADQEEQMKLDKVAQHPIGTVCPYCEKERREVNYATVIDNEFSYACVVCNLEYLNWKSGEQHNTYNNARLQKELNKALEYDRNNNDVAWKSHLKTIAERSEIYVRENTED